MKIFLAGLLLFSVLGVLISTFSPFLYQGFYPKKSKTGRMKIIIFRPALILIFLFLAAASFTGWQNVEYSESLPPTEDNLIDTVAYAQKQYPVYSSQYKLQKVIGGNGKQVQVNIRGNGTKVQLIGVSAFKNKSDKHQNACFAKYADAMLRSYLKDKKIELEGDDSLADKNKTNALLRYVIVEDKNINKQMIGSGYAKAGDGEYKYRHEFLSAEKEAKGQGLGFWSGTICNDDLAPSSSKTSYRKTSRQSDESDKFETHRGKSGRESTGDYYDNSNKSCDSSNILGSLFNIVLRRC